VSGFEPCVLRCAVVMARSWQQDRGWTTHVHFGSTSPSTPRGSNPTRYARPSRSSTWRVARATRLRQRRAARACPRGRERVRATVAGTCSPWWPTARGAGGLLTHTLSSIIRDKTPHVRRQPHAARARRRVGARVEPRVILVLQAMQSCNTTPVSAPGAQPYLTLLDFVAALYEVRYDVEYSGAKHGNVDLEDDHNS
jgi:hypothetical protein